MGYSVEASESQLGTGQLPLLCPWLVLGSPRDACLGFPRLW